MKGKQVTALMLCMALALTVLSGCGTKNKKKDPVSITVWHYYSGSQQQSFDQLLAEFNEGIGAEKGIVVEGHSYGGVSELNEKVLDAVYGRVGAEEVPDVFASYADTAYEISSMGKVADLSQYLTEEEQARYIAGYLDEGRFGDGAGFSIFPVAKATELLYLNQTDWDAFAEATGASAADLTTWEGIASLAEDYYVWTDSLTPDVADDGKAFFGRDAFANYIIIGSMQLGTELFQVTDGTVAVQVGRDVMRRLWDNYYVPYLNGYYTAKGRFRSDDIRTGDVIACVGSSSGTTFFANEVTSDDGSTRPIEMAVYALPNFAGTEAMAVQQGAGMVVTRSTEERERAAVEFLKWFTEPEQNTRFAMDSGYLPVTYAGNDESRIQEAEQEKPMSGLLRDSLTMGVRMATEYRFYTSRPFARGSHARSVVESSMRDKAAADRAEVEALMAGGTSREAAVAWYNTEENFNAWYEDFQAALNETAAE